MLREAVQLQRFLERDSRGGSRYTETVWAHFHVESPDARQQRPEYLGGGTLNSYRDWETDRKSTRLNSSHRSLSRMPSSA